MGIKNQYLKNYQEYFNTLNIIFYLGIGLPLTLFIIFYLQFDKEGSLVGLPDEPNILLHFLVPLIAIGLIYAAYRYAMIKTREIDTSLPFKSKLQHYLNILLGKYILLTLASLVIIFAFYYSHQKIFSVYYTLTLVFYTLNRPRDRQLVKELKLSQEEKDKLYSEEDY